ncbi:MAG: hypothetical protein JO364_20245 [Pseudonocardiales bacterium]|nr:hypothetical protein [Pseudonocardiales bacterium]MBV9032585.1 hypothetical protein [Pseudonocardiales bacterium]
MPRALGAFCAAVPRQHRRVAEWALRVRVYAGLDQVSKRRHYLTEIIAAGPGADRRMRATRDRLISQVEERRNPRTSATVDQLLERYLDQFDGAPSTLTLYRGYVRNHIAPFLGKIKLSALDADILDSFYAELRRCRDHCSGRPFVQHRTAVEHRCDDHCGQHRCRPLGATTIRTCISSSPAPTRARCAGSGSWSTRCARLSLRPHPCLTRTRRVQPRPPGSSTRRGRTPTGAR